MPGTHTKWVSLHDGVVQEFLTAPTGELFAMLCEHSVLVRDQATPIVHHAARISSAGSRSRRSHPEVTLLHRLFQSRSLRLDKQLSRRRRGIVDVGAAHRHRRRRRAVAVRRDTMPRAPVYVIGAPQLTESYRRALARHGRKAVRIDGDEGRARRARATCIASRSART